jgi:DNA uptake protein ComE-like DNA-binding protein
MDVFIAEMEKSKSKTKDSLFVFDPNTIDSASLILLGFSPAQAKSIINYRKKGGKFYTKENFGRSYAVSDKMFERLYNYIVINSFNSEFSRKPVTPKTDRSKKQSNVHPFTETTEKQPVRKTPVAIELNAADTVTLQKLKGIGSYYAKKIADYRDRLGGFYQPEQLMEIRGIDSARFAMFCEQIVVDVSQIKRIEINRADEKELSKHPYINAYIARSIVKYRKFKGNISSIDELVSEKIVTLQQSDRIVNYIEF